MTLENYISALMFFVVACLLGVAAYALLCFPTFTGQKARRRRINVKYLCTTHLQKGRKNKEFVILKDIDCDVCKKEKKV